MVGALMFWGCFWLIVLSIICVSLACTKTKAFAACGLALLMFFCFLAMSPALFLTSLVMFLTICSWPQHPARPKYLSLACIGIVTLASAFVVPSVLQRQHEIDDWRQEFAFRSVADRLQYEENATPSDATIAAETAATLKPEIEQRLARFEQHNSHSGSRVRMLERLHDDTRAEFEVLTGFGPIRMMRLHRRYLELPPDEQAPVPQPQPAEAPSEFDERWTSLETIPIPGVDQDKLLTLHDVGLSDFLDPERMGYVQDREHVAGFDSHRFKQLPELYASAGSNRWEVQRLELIGLLSHDRPVAYVTEHLPDLEEMGEAAVRELDEFEHDALKQLQTERDIVTAEHGSSIRMLGAVRASQSCLECHQVQRGDLLGAFSYIIAPQGGGQLESIAATIRGD
jgi:hypothetical protein